ncbi:MAG: hypothetical protein M1831_001067 [Alyxoria varia]|nr:MAG: hypothetical protein M1831_001067 [Alyxoria varia]
MATDWGNNWGVGPAEQSSDPHGGWGAQPPTPPLAPLRTISTQIPSQDRNQRELNLAHWVNSQAPDFGGINPRNVAQARDQQFNERAGRRGGRGPRGNRGNQSFRGKRSNWPQDTGWKNHSQVNQWQPQQPQNTGWAQTVQPPWNNATPQDSADPKPNGSGNAGKLPSQDNGTPHRVEVSKPQEPNNQQGDVKQEDKTSLKPEGTKPEGQRDEVHGAKQDQPETLKPHDQNNDWIDANQDKQTPPKPKVQLPNTPNNDWSAPQKDNQTPQSRPQSQSARKDQPKQSDTPRPRSSGVKTRGNNDRRTNDLERKQNNRFATSAETRPDPEPDVFDDDDAQVASDHADNGFLDTKVLAQAHKMEEGEFSLQAWDGGWAPAPVDWEDRPSNHDDHFKYRVVIWEPHADAKYDVSLSGESLRDIEGEICPRSWVPETIDGDPADEWWKKRVEAEEFLRDPFFYDCYIEPFWRRFKGLEIEALQAVEVPDPNVDREDNDILSLNQTVESTIAVRLQKSHRRRDKSQKHVAMQRERAMLELQIGNQNQYSPKLNCYLRPVEQSDMPQIQKIWNHWIEKSITTPEVEPLPVSHIEERWTDICDANLPFVVAVNRSAKSMKPRQRRASTNYNTNNNANNEPVESILGFAFADDYNDIRGMYRYTVELEVFIKSDCRRKGIGRCLLDKMLQILDIAHDPRGGYDFPNEDAKYCAGGNRTIGNIIVNVPYASDDQGPLKWKKAWLEQFKFQKAGELTNVGRKLNKKWVVRNRNCLSQMLTD